MYIPWPWSHAQHAVPPHFLMATAHLSSGLAGSLSSGETSPKLKQLISALATGWLAIILGVSLSSSQRLNLATTRSRIDGYKLGGDSIKPP